MAQQAVNYIWLADRDIKYIPHIKAYMEEKYGEFSFKPMARQATHGWKRNYKQCMCGSVEGAAFAGKVLAACHGQFGDTVDGFVCDK